ncbi:hypothetical protein CHUAL_012431 [Chamberlinius hualienensis]
MWRSKVEPLCTTRELVNIIVAPSGGIYVLPTDPYNEVYPNIFVGDVSTALCTQVLKRIGITHVLNAAQGKEKFYFVNTSAGYYEMHGIKFLGIPAVDFMNFKMEPYFEQAADFVEEGVKAGGKVLIHCRVGVSRSATLALAYLIIKKGMTAQDAMRTVRAQREIIPNPGFLQQLCDLNERIHRQKRATDGTTQH